MNDQKTLRCRKEKSLVVWALLSLALVLIVPLIYWDALGSGAMHFMRYSRVSVAGSSAGDSHATFFFGLLYTLKHMGPGVFIPAQLFSAQWRVLMNTTEVSATADLLGKVSLVLVCAMIVSFVVMAVFYSIDQRRKTDDSRTASAIALVCGILELIVVIWFGVIVAVMASKISNYGFRIYDFLAYGGHKCSMEVILNLLLAVKNFNLVRLLKKQ